MNSVMMSRVSVCALTFLCVCAESVTKPENTQLGYTMPVTMLPSQNSLHIYYDKIMTFCLFWCSAGFFPDVHAHNIFA
jgi:hypothetical protein